MGRVVRLLLALALVAGCGVVGSSGSTGGTGSAGSTAPAPSTPAASTPAPTPTPTPRPTPTTDPGTLPQTRDRPTAADPQFRAGIRQLWTAAVSGQPRYGLPFFFPLSAYRQVKAISDPEHDWRTRLVDLYDLDIGAIHASLPAGATLTGVDVPDSAQWVNPGEEYNALGYWRVYGTRVHYRAGGQDRSFSICSMISWRGRWYGVHLGPITRSGQSGRLCTY